MLRTPFGGALVGAALACLAAMVVCASSDRSVGELHGPATTLTGGLGGSGTGGGDASAGAGGTSVSGSCAPHGVACTTPTECCSSFCVAGTCIDPRRCRGEGIECEVSSVCCSGRCE